MNLNFQNTAVKYLPVDPITNNYTRKVEACLSQVKPTPVKNPQLIHSSKDALDLVDIDMNQVSKRDFPFYFSGNQLLPGSQPTAFCYCGHQFGVFAGQLGDGRAINLGEIVNKKGERWELQLKGSGKTPYSRHADGRAVLRSSIREYLCSEAMHYLGVPTTRAATLIVSDTKVDRDKKYDGNVIKENATIVSRLAPTFIRFGSFQIADPEDVETGTPGPSSGNKVIITQLLNYTIQFHYPHIFKKFSSIEERTVAFAQELAWRTARTCAMWQAFGFTHGVLNTDNMSILGLTIDYGPFGFMDDYDPDFVPNKSDKEGRYRFQNQPGICKWNLEKLFKSISLAIPSITDRLNKIHDNFCDKYEQLYLDQMRVKLGLFQKLPEDEKLVESLLSTINATKGDYTNIFRSLSRFQLDKNADEQPILEYILKQTQVPADAEKTNRTIWIYWLESYKKRLDKEFTTNNSKRLSNRVYIMNTTNPKYILRNYMAQEAIEKAEKGDYSEVDKIFDLLKDPFNEERKYDGQGYDKVPPAKSKNLTLTCSS